MATLITKNSSTAASAPLAAQLTKGELAVNVTDKRLFTKDNGGAVVEVGTNPSALSLPNGTANGVTYLNGSKALTSGSALTFDGTNFSASGVSSFDEIRLGNSEYIYLGNSQNLQISHSGSNGLITNQTGLLTINNAASSLVFSASNAEAMRLTSTGLGIGTSSPGEKLTVAGAGLFTGALSNYRTSSMAVDWFGGAARIWAFGPDASTAGRIEFNTASNNGSVANTMYYNASGNMGLGVTPSAWLTATKAIQVGDYGTFSFDGYAGSTVVGNNVFQSGNTTEKYIASGVASAKYRLSGGADAWFVAPSGTAGNAITFTQAMTLDASGRLGIGSTSPTSPLTVSSSAATIGQLISSGASCYLEMDNSGGAGYIGTNGNNILFLTSSSGTERARIDSSGNLLVGKTALSDSTAGVQIYGGSNGVIGLGTDGTAGHNNLEFFRGTAGSLSLVGKIQTTGTATSYVTSSDYRLKEAVEPMTGALAKVAALNPCTYKWKSDGSASQGFIAHELQAVVPECVTGEKDAVDEDGKPVYQGIDTSFLVATLTAAIQEQQALIQTLAAKVAALEGATNA